MRSVAVTSTVPCPTSRRSSLILRTSNTSFLMSMAENARRIRESVRLKGAEVGVTWFWAGRWDEEMWVYLSEGD